MDDAVLGDAAKGEDHGEEEGENDASFHFGGGAGVRRRGQELAAL
jgi:hypothetical protein